MKYVQDFSSSFENESILLEEIHFEFRVQYLKAIHVLDGQTYILKKIHIFLLNDQDIQDHPVYKQILEVKDSNLPLNIRYVNSWVELDSTFKINSQQIDTNSGLNVILCIQMRYIDDFERLAKDLIVATSADKNLDEDTIDEMADNSYEEAMTLIKNGIEFATAIKESPNIDKLPYYLIVILFSLNKTRFLELSESANLEQMVWKLCFEDSISNY